MTREEKAARDGLINERAGLRAQVAALEAERGVAVASGDVARMADVRERRAKADADIGRVNAALRAYHTEGSRITSILRCPSARDGNQCALDAKHTGRHSAIGPWIPGVDGYAQRHPTTAATVRHGDVVAAMAAVCRAAREWTEGDDPDDERVEDELVDRVRALERLVPATFWIEPD